MKINSLITGVIGVVICAIMIGGAFLPAITGSIDDIGTKYNNTAGVLAKVYDGETIVIDIDAETGGINVNGETVSSADLAVISDKFVVRTYAGGMLYNSIDGTTERTTDLSISINADVATIEGTTYDLDWCFYANPEGDYRMFPNSSSTMDVYVNSINQIYGSNWITTTGKWFSFHGDDVLINGDTAVKAQYTLNPVDGYTNLNTIKVGGGSEGEYSFMDGDYKVLPRFWVMPAEIEAYTATESAIVGMLNVLPIVAIAGLILAAIYVFISRK